MKSSSKFVLALVIALLMALAAYWYWSPFLAVRDLQKAAQAGDADTFNSHVDYPRLRESLKTQLSALLAQKMGATPDNGNPLAALGGMIGQRLLNPLVDAMVRPDVVMAAMKSGQWGRGAAAPAVPAAAAVAPPVPGPPGAQLVPPAVPAPPATAAAPSADDARNRWVIERQGASRMTAYAVDPARPDEADADRLGLVFERSGFADWKLTDIRLPAAAFRP